MTGLLVLCAGLQGVHAAQATAWEIVARGAHERRWERSVLRTQPDGTSNWAPESYVELATAMHYWEDQQWKESKEEIEILEGYAVASQGPHKVLFGANLNAAGAIDLLAPDGKRMRSHILGLAYDVAPGAARSISILKNVLKQGVSYHLKLHDPDSFGFFLQRNIYTNATGIVAPFLDPTGSAVHIVY